MKIKRINQIDPVEFTGGISFRAILEADNMGFAMMKTVIPKGGPHHWHYQHHLEACYCIKGKGELVNLSTGVGHLIIPDTIYILDKHDDHTFEAFEDTVLISVFNPPLTGREKHDKDGIYEAPKRPMLAKDIVAAVNNCSNDYDAVDIVNELLKR